jgi:tryptophan synthase alpha chain
MFAQAKAEQRAAFLPYFTLGYPNYDASLEIIKGMADAGVDGFEIGVPFSDPLADGPVLQMAALAALEQGITVRKCLEGIRTLRAQGVHQPMFVFSYLNPLLAYGAEQIVRDAKAAGADGFIIPDLPAEEADLFAPYCEAEGMALVFFLAPTSNPRRIEIASQNARGFIYVVSVTGITGARRDLPPDLTDFIARLRQATDQPLVLGFGISTPEQARSMNTLVDGFIVGSALVRAAQESPAAAVALGQSLRAALD